MDTRNCENRLGLSDDARIVEDYTPEIEAEHSDKNALKVVGVYGSRLYECPLTVFNDDTHGIMRLCHLVDDTKQLLHEGGWGYQPFWLVEAYEMFKTEAYHAMKKDRPNG